MLSPGLLSLFCPKQHWNIHICCCVSSSVVSNSLWPHRLYSPLESSVHGILQARILERVTIPFSRGSSWPGDWTLFSCIAGRFFTVWAAREAQNIHSVQFSSVQFSSSVVSNSLRPHESQHARPPCPSPTPRVYSNSCPLSQWCHPAISSCVVPFSSCPQSFPASGSFPMSQLFSLGGQSTGVLASASVLPMNTQDWSPSGWTGWISSQSDITMCKIDGWWKVAV